MDEDTTYAVAMVISTALLCVILLFYMSTSENFFSAGMADSSNIKTYGMSSFFPSIIPQEKSFAENESYLKYTFDGIVNYDQVSRNRGIDFKKCYSGDSHELDDAMESDTHYIKIRGNTPDEALGTISLPGVRLNAGYSIPDPKRLYVSKFKQVSPNEYKLWIITKEPVVETIDGALESTCKVSYYY
jgi:hypothetical protein